MLQAVSRVVLISFHGFASFYWTEGVSDKTSTRFVRCVRGGGPLSEY
jgi:hypothetical protein